MAATIDQLPQGSNPPALYTCPLHACVFLLYLVAYLDRANVSFAALKMNLDLGFSDRIYGLGVAMFFVGYVLFEVPGAIIVERWSARKWPARIMISWGLATILSGMVHAPDSSMRPVSFWGWQRQVFSQE